MARQAAEESYRVAFEMAVEQMRTRGRLSKDNICGIGCARQFRVEVDYSASPKSAQT